MRGALPLLLLLLAGCPAGEPRASVARWLVTGDARGERAVDDQAGGRVTCTVDAERESPVDDRPLLTFAAVAASDGRRQPAFYMTARGFDGAGAYHLGTGPGDRRGHAVFFDEGLLAECALPGDTSCYQATIGCTVTVETWELGEPVPPGVRNGVGTGRFECAQLDNATSDGHVTIAGGTFTCRASDWTGAR
jgi:hypothetical protein